MALLASILFVQINSFPSVIMPISEVSEVLVFMAKTSRFLINVGGRSIF